MRRLGRNAVRQRLHMEGALESGAAEVTRSAGDSRQHNHEDSDNKHNPYPEYHDGPKTGRIRT